MYEAKEDTPLGIIWNSPLQKSCELSPRFFLPVQIDNVRKDDIEKGWPPSHRRWYAFGSLVTVRYTMQTMRFFIKRVEFRFLSFILFVNLIPLEEPLAHLRIPLEDPLAHLRLPAVYTTIQTVRTVSSENWKIFNSRNTTSAKTLPQYQDTRVYQLAFTLEEQIVEGSILEICGCKASFGAYQKNVANISRMIV